MDWNIAKHIMDRLAPDAALIDARRGSSVDSGLAETVASAAGAMRARGLEPGQRLAIGCEQTLWTVLAYLGAQYAGLTAVPVERDKLPAALGALGAEGAWVPEPDWLEGLPAPRTAALVGAEALFGNALPDGPSGPAPAPDALPDVPAIAPTGHWIENSQNDWQKATAKLLANAVLAAAPYRAKLDPDEQKMADYAVQSEIGFPIYLGGPFALLDSVGSAGIRRMLEA